MSVLAGLGNAVFAVVDVTASIVLGVFVCGFIGYAACGGFGLLGSRSARRASGALEHPEVLATAPSFRPPTAAELRVDPVVFDRATKALLGRMAFDVRWLPRRR